MPSSRSPAVSIGRSAVQRMPAPRAGRPRCPDRADDQGAAAAAPVECPTGSPRRSSLIAPSASTGLSAFAARSCTAVRPCIRRPVSSVSAPVGAAVGTHGLAGPLGIAPAHLRLRTQAPAVEESLLGPKLGAAAAVVIVHDAFQQGLCPSLPCAVRISRMREVLIAPCRGTTQPFAETHAPRPADAHPRRPGALLRRPSAGPPVGARGRARDREGRRALDL
jgi:hypothetical protein